MGNKILPYKAGLQEFAMYLRQNITPAEQSLWEILSNQQMKGYDFELKKPIDEFIVDFYCKELMLAIEIDESDHGHPDAYTEILNQMERIQRFGVIFLRFDEDEVLNERERVIEKIESGIHEITFY